MYYTKTIRAAEWPCIASRPSALRLGLHGLQRVATQRILSPQPPPELPRRRPRPRRPRRSKFSNRLTEKARGDKPRAFPFAHHSRPQVTSTDRKPEVVPGSMVSGILSRRHSRAPCASVWSTAGSPFLPTSCAPTHNPCRCPRRFVATDQTLCTSH